MHILYLHGLASSPRSTKATFLTEELAKIGHTLLAPDLNLPSFENLSFAAIMEGAEAKLKPLLAHPKTAIIGSSLGCLVALHLLAKNPAAAQKVKRLILMAPAFDFRHNKQLTSEVLEVWRSRGKIPVYHSLTKTERELPYSFLLELETLPAVTPPSIPTLIIHGREDEVIDVQNSRDFVKGAPQTRLLEVASDHQMLSALDKILAAVTAFLQS